MDKKERYIQRQILNDALQKSFRRMLDVKKKLGQSVVTVDLKGNPIVITAEEAEALVLKTKGKKGAVDSLEMDF